MDLDHERCYRAVASRDARFDGVFVTAVRTTGIYCRPSCPALTPKRANVTFLPTAAAAQRQGYRACRRCRPDASPGSPEWSVRADTVGRVMRMIADGAVDRLGVAGVAAALGYSERHLNRVVTAELGAGVLAIARAQRAQAARILLETTSMPAADVAWAAGFGSVRSFNETVTAVYGVAPTQLRRAAGFARQAADGVGLAGVGGSGGRAGVGPGARVDVRLPARAPFDAHGVLRFLGARAVPGVESWDGGQYRRALDLPHGHGVVECRAADSAPGLLAAFRLADLRDLAPAVARVRRLFDLDADPLAVAEVLRGDPILAASVRARPGLRCAVSVDPHEMLVRAIVGQQVSVAGARTVVGRLVRSHGQPLDLTDPELTHVFPTAARLADLDPATASMPAARSRALAGACSALASGAVVLDTGADRVGALEALGRLPGIGPWTRAYVAMRGLGDPDVLPASDLGVRRAVEASGFSARPAAIEELGHAWRPWRSYATAHLWAGPVLEDEAAVALGPAREESA